MGRLFWTAMALIGAGFVHICFVLFAPVGMFRALSPLETDASQSNKLVLLSPDTRRTMLPALRGPGVAAYCDIDLTQGAVSIVMRPPQTYWSLSVFSQGGRQLYALNERQADTEEIAIEFKRAPGLLEQLSGTGDEEGVSIIDSAAWSVELKDKHAYAVLWIPYGDPMFAKIGEETVKASTCAVKKKA